MDDTHIVGLMSEIARSFDHLLTQSALVGLRVKVLKCKLWSPLGIFPSIEIPQGYTLVTYDLLGGSIFVFYVSYFQHTRFGGICFSS